MVNDYARLLSVFEHVFDLDADARAREVRRLAGGDMVLEAEVLALLEESEGLGDAFLTTTVLGERLQNGATGRDEGGRSGDAAGGTPVIDGYAVGARIGRGATGTVYKARSTGSLARDVAIKVLHADLPPSVNERFAREQRLLATLNHPGVAQVYDAGRTLDGRAFVAVEYVDGVSVTAFAETLPDWRARVRLIERVCEAVQHIHASGVLHRDLKPSNILVTESEAGEPAPKVIDFGAATALRADLASVTQDPRLIGTIAYMAPEQLDHSRRADARSDVYALGVLLYQLLLGEHPFGAERVGLAELVRRIESGALPRLPKGRFGSERGELEAVLQKACAVEPAKRYPSAQHFADDLRRVRMRLPIEARKPSLQYRALAAISRRPATSAMAALAVLVVVVLVAWLAESSRRSALETQRVQATAAELVDGVLDQLGELDGVLAMRESMANAILGRLNELPGAASDPEILWQRSRVLESLGDVALARGEAERAVALRREVLDWRRSPLVSGLDAGRREAGVSLAMIKLGDALNDLGQRDEALRLYLQVHDSFEERFAAHPDDPDLADDLCWSLERLVPFYDKHDPVHAELLARRRLSLAWGLVRSHPDDERHLFNLACGLSWSAVLVQRDGDLKQARRRRGRAIEVLDRLVESNPNRHWYRSRQVGAYNAQVALLFEMGSPNAERGAERALVLAEEFRTANPESDLARALHRTALKGYIEGLESRGQLSGDAAGRLEELREALRTLDQGASGLGL